MHRWIGRSLLTSFLIGGFLSACAGSGSAPNTSGFEVKFLVGSALEQFCTQAAERLNQTQPKLNSGERFYLSCEAVGSGDAVTRLVSLANQLKQGSLAAEAPEFPTLISVDGEIYQSLLIARMNEQFPGQNYIPAITDAPLLANSPMVFMAPTNLAAGIRKSEDLFKTLATADTHQDIDPASPPVKIHYVHTAPNRSNSGLQTLVSQYVSVSDKRPENLTLEDVNRFAPDIQKIQQKITRYGVSTNSLAQAMVQNGPFWASVGSVYESSVIVANASLQPGQTRYEAIYPKATYTSNMRAILPNAPWISDSERTAAEQVIEYLRSPEIQQIATSLGLRPGVSNVPLGAKFTPEFGVEANAQYDSYRPPSPQVAEAMITNWATLTKKPSRVAIVIDSSGSMQGNKMPAVQNTLLTYINALGPTDEIALFDFDAELRPPVQVSGTSEGRNRGIQFVSSLEVAGGTALYDATLYAQTWLFKNLRPNAINAVLVLTDGEDTNSNITLEQLNQRLKETGFETDARIAVFTIGYGNEGEFNPQALQAIAGGNGGYYKKGDPATIAEVMENLQLEF